MSEPFRTFLELDTAVNATYADSWITSFNHAATEFWGRHPSHSEEWFGCLRLVELEARPISHADSPMAIVLKETNRPIRCLTAVAERSDCRRVVFEPHPTHPELPT